ncbi:MAG: hypothetical protein ISEC1_P2061 [Thiomicrorhabdus sp.]|nr:MAG: hypothetical protein ISEC1_P2061 [Thiomicrorhabdus sp.]
MSRNSEYEKRQKQRGLKKVTIWVPDDTVCEFKIMADFCVENRDHFPFMARSHKTGVMRKP